MALKRPDRVRGAGHDEFWGWCNKGELRLQRCTQCGHMPWPVVQACEQCGETAFEWEALSGRGTIVSWCAFEHDYYRGLFAIPHDAIVVELEGGPLFISNPDGFGYDDIVPGMPVIASFVDAEDSAGPFRLPLFAKA